MTASLELVQCVIIFGGKKNKKPTKQIQKNHLGTECDILFKVLVHTFLALQPATTRGSNLDALLC